MSDFKSRHMIEALRSGIPSRTIGADFSVSRPALISSISEDLKDVINGTTKGRFVQGRYGEGKTHLLNTVFSLAHERNMVVSILSFSKEAPANNLPVIYKKLMENTYLPGHILPGFSSELDSLREGQDRVQRLLSELKELDTDRVYNVLKTYLRSEEIEDRFTLSGDLEGDFVSTVPIKAAYRKAFGSRLVFERPFNKNRNAIDYFCFASLLFNALGYSGWVILFDEAELIGRLSRTARKKAYLNFNALLHPVCSLVNTYTLTAFSTSFKTDVLEGRDEAVSIRLAGEEEKLQERMLRTIDDISSSEELKQLTESELKVAIAQIIELYGKAYDFDVMVSPEELYQIASKTGFLLRTKIRASLEYLDQLYQYGNAEELKVGQVESGKIEEIPSLDDLFKDLN